MTRPWYSFRMKRNDEEKKVAAFAYGWSAAQAWEPVKLDDKQDSFIFRFPAWRSQIAIERER